MHVETSFARNLGDLTHSCPDRHTGPAHAGNSRTMSTHAGEESDEGVVPMKRPNKEGLSSAEAVEGRTSPKGNGGETAAARTLSQGAGGAAPAGLPGYVARRYCNRTAMALFEALGFS